MLIIMICIYDKQQYELFKNKRLKTKIICDICGGVYIYFNKWAHLRTKNHIKYSIIFNND